MIPEIATGSPDRRRSYSILGGHPKLEARARVALDWIAASTLVAFPWSTTATGLLAAAWTVAFLFTLDFVEGFKRWREPVIAFPIALCLFAIVGMLWANAPWDQRIAGALPYAKLWVMTWMITHFAHSTNVLRIVLAFAASVLVFCMYAWITFFFPMLGPAGKLPGIPIHDRIYLGVIFAVTALALIYVCVSSWQKHQTMVAAVSAALAVSLIAHVLVVAPSRTAIAILIVLLPLVFLQLLAWRMVILVSLATLLLGIAVASLSPALRLRVNETFSGMATPISAAETSENLRLAYWRRAVALMREAPIVGHGTGSTRRAFAEIDGYDLKQGVPNNPHNQTLAVGTQLGAIGVFLLWGMWLTHLLSSRGQRWEAKLCALIVLQNVIASMFNSHLFDFTAGWMYVLGVGILGGAVWAHRPANAPAGG